MIASIWKQIVWSLRLRRVEYRIAEIPIFLIPSLLAIPSASVFRGAIFWEGLCAFLFLFSYGDLLNCLADRELDSIYKPQLTEAVRGLGIRNVIVQIVLSGAAAMALSIHMAWLLDRWLLLPMAVAGLFVAYAYSIEPLRLKRRGLWQLAFYWIGLFTGPMIFTAYLFDPAPSSTVLLVAAFYGLMQTGVILVNTAEDFPEDRKLGVRTAIVALGLKGGIGFAGVLHLLGGAGLIATLVVRLEFKIAIAPLAGAWLGVGLALARLRLSLRGLDEEAACVAVKRAARFVPLWITSVALSTLLAAGACAYERLRAIE